MADFEELRNMVSSFRVSELQVLLGFAGRNKSGRKHDLLMRALHLLKSGCSPAVQIKIRELYRRRYPRTLEGLSDLSTIKSSVFSLDGNSSPVEPDLAVAGIHTLPSTSVTPHSPSSPVGSLLLQDTKPTFEMQQPSPPIPPVHPDVQLKNLPFYDVLDVLIKPTSLVQSSIQRFQEKFFIFALTPQQVREICISRDFLPGGRRDYTVQVQLRLCLAETSCPQEDNYPNSLCIKVNGKLFPLPGYAPPPKNGIEQKRPGRPLNITSLVRLSSAVPNQISISWASEIGKNYSMSVYLVRQLTSAMLLQRLKMKGIRNPDHSRALIKEKLTADPDSEIATTSLRVSLMCPLGKMRLTIPCRAVTCTHLQCFDAALYLQMNEKKPTWICPVCDKKAAYESLILDGLFMEILSDCSDVDEIKFQEDGSWCPMRPKKEAMKVSSQPCTKIESSSVLSKPCSVTVANEASKKKVDVIDLTIESSSDEEEDPPAKRKCIFMSETQSSPTKGVLMYQPSSVRVPSVTSVDPAAIPPSLTDYSVPFHHTPISSMSSDLPAFSSVTPQMSSSTEDSEFEPSLRSLNTSDNSASSSDNDYFSTSEEEEGGEGRAWRSLELSEEHMNAPPPRFPFTGNPGIKIDENPAELSPFEFFSLFIDKRIIDSVLVETNRFAEQTGQDDSLWRPVTEAELFVFFAMKMLGRIVKMPEEEMNWSHDELLERPIFRQLMTMERYSKIKQYLHFVDNETHDAQTHPNPKLYKIYDVFMTLCENFGKYYTPRQDVCIDESLMLFKGRLGWVQYIPLKRRRFGVKYFMLCESKTGYVYNMTIYVGKGTQFDPEYDAYPVSSRVVLSLMKPLFGKGYCVTVDNYYTSPQLADALVMNQTDTYGTLRMNRKEVPEELKRKRKKLKKGEVAAFQRGKVMTLRWKDKKDVAMLSTIHNPAMHDIETRQGPVKKPKVVCEYNHTMGGVDKVDQQLVDYPIPRKRGKKYYKTVFFHLMDIGVWNAFILHQEAFTQSGKKSLTHLKFRLEIIRYIFGKYGPALPPRSPVRPSTSPGSLRQTPGGHFPMEVPPTEKKKNPSRKCVVCSLKRDHRGKQVRKESRYMCKVCQVALCVVPCFEKYHSK